MLGVAVGLRPACCREQFPSVTSSNPGPTLGAGKSWPVRSQELVKDIKGSGISRAGRGFLESLESEQKAQPPSRCKASQLCQAAKTHPGALT